MSSQRELERALARRVATAAVAANEAYRSGDFEELAALLGVNEENAVRLVGLLEREPEA